MSELRLGQVRDFVRSSNVPIVYVKGTPDRYRVDGRSVREFLAALNRDPAPRGPLSVISNSKDLLLWAQQQVVLLPTFTNS